MPVVIGTYLPDCNESDIDNINDIRKMGLWRVPSGFTTWTARKDAVLEHCYILCAIDWEV